MILTDASGRKWKLYFKYGEVEEVGRRTRTATIARLDLLRDNRRTDYATGTEFSGLRVAGLTLCSEKDGFNKETGRSLALDRALEELAPFVTAPDVVALREAYITRPGGRRDRDAKQLKRIADKITKQISEEIVRRSLKGVNTFAHLFSPSSLRVHVA